MPRRTRPWPAGVLLAAGAALAFEAPFLSGRVHDEAGIIPGEVRARLEQTLADFERRSTHQVVVLTVESLQGLSIEDYSLKVAEAWKLGQAGKNNGVLFTVAPNDRQMRLEVGYGIEETLTDSRCGRILDNLVRPAFRAGDFGAGIEAGVGAVIAVLEGSPPPESEEPGGAFFPAPSAADWAGRLVGGAVFTLVIGMFSFLAVFAPGRQNYILYFFLLPFYLLFPSFIIHPLAGPILAGAWLALFPLLRVLIHGTSWGKSFLAAHPALSKITVSSGSSGGGSFRSGGFSSRSGGFSGGGGSFGGGGASRSW